MSWRDIHKARVEFYEWQVYGLPYTQYMPLWIQYLDFRESSWLVPWVVKFSASWWAGDAGRPGENTATTAAPLSRDPITLTDEAAKRGDTSLSCILENYNTFHVFGIGIASLVYLDFPPPTRHKAVLLSHLLKWRYKYFLTIHLSCFSCGRLLVNNHSV